MTMHRRPLGRGRTLAAVAAPLVVIGPILPWWQVGGTPGIPVESGNGLPGVGIVIFLVGIATLALLALPYAAGDRPVALDRWLSFALLAVAGWLAFVWRLVELAMLGAFQFTEPIQIFTHSPGVWVTGIGLAILARAAWTMSREPAYR
jgi:hypothetical protein